MKLSSLTPQDKLRLAAELDGWTNVQFDSEIVKNWWENNPIGVPPTADKNSVFRFNKLLPYATSYDAIIPLIQKQDVVIKSELVFALLKGNSKDESVPFDLGDFWILLDATPAQLLDALLVATGKAEL